MHQAQKRGGGKQRSSRTPKPKTVKHKHRGKSSKRGAQPDQKNQQSVRLPPQPPKTQTPQPLKDRRGKKDEPSEPHVTSCLNVERDHWAIKKGGQMGKKTRCVNISDKIRLKKIPTTKLIGGLKGNKGLQTTPGT